MQELKEFILKNTTKNKQEIQKSVLEMHCDFDEPIALSQTTLLDALKIHGEFLVLKLHYDDFTDELQDEIIKYKISQALSVIVTYEDDGSSFEKIEKFVNYIHDISDSQQNSTFGVKRVAKLSEFPITILFSGILPINQLSMNIGQDIYELIHSDDTYFPQRFLEFREILSQEIGIPILPLFPRLDKELKPAQVVLRDLLDNRVISSFELIHNPDKDAVESYLVKLFYIYKILAEQKKCISSH